MSLPVMSAPLVSDDDHPLFIELKVIRETLARCQEEYRASAVRLQRRSLDNSQNHERTVYLQRENDLLKAELAVLRTTPKQLEPSPESKAHIQELTLSLRRLSLKLTMTEGALVEKTKALLDAHSDVKKAQAARDAANDLTAELRAREEAERVKVKDLALKIKKQEEELRMLDIVIGKYAELVRQLESRPKPADQGNAEAIRSKSSTLDSALSHGRFDLQHVIEDFRSRYDDTYQELETTRGELEMVRSQLIARQQAEQAVMEDFTQAKVALDQLKINDGTAAKMVARYMQFSQSSTNSLLASLEALKTRHAATVSTLSSQNQLLLTRIHSLELQNEQLRNSLDDLGGEVLKEKYTRRREIGLRIRMEGREQRIVEGLRRWVWQSEEAARRLDCQEGGGQSGNAEHRENNVLLTLSQSARILLDSLEHGGADEECAVSLSGSRARELMVRGGVDGLLEELRLETERRVMLLISVDEQEKLESPEYPTESKRDGHDTDSSLGQSNPRDVRGDEATFAVTPSSPEVENGNPHSEEVIPLQSAVRSPPSPAENRDITHDEINTENPDDDPHLESDKGVLSQDNLINESPIVEPPSYSTDAPPPVVNDEPDDSSPIPISITAHQMDVHADLVTEPSQEHSSTSHSVLPADAYPLPICRQQSSRETDVANPDSPSPKTSGVSEVPIQPSLHPLLAELAEVKKRYDVFQREFRDCHLALEGLTASLASRSSSHPSSSSTEVHWLLAEVLRPAVARLDDFTEDVRVELEIKIGDEALLVKGYEALLRVPGALSSYVEVPSGEDPDAPFSTGIEQQIKAFADGTDPIVKRTMAMFKAKLEDIQHDIAVLKRAIHDPESILCEQSLPDSGSSSIIVPSTDKSEQGSNPAAHPTAGSWSSWIGSPSKTITPTSGFGPSPTFGNIMTNPRLRQPSSQMVDRTFTEEASRGLGILGSFVGLSGKDAPPPKDPLSVLGLKVAMPSFNPDGYGVVGNGVVSPALTSASFLGSPSYPSNRPPPTPRSRTSSAMYMLGLGAFGGSGRMSRTASNGGMNNRVKPEVDLEDAGRTGINDDVE